jgi:hypothetical protein
MASFHLDSWLAGPANLIGGDIGQEMVALGQPIAKVHTNERTKARF